MILVESAGEIKVKTASIMRRDSFSVDSKFKEHGLSLEGQLNFREVEERERNHSAGTEWRS